MLGGELLFYSTYIHYICLMQSCFWGGDDIYEILYLAVRSETNSALLVAHIKSVKITIRMVPLTPCAGRVAKDNRDHGHQEAWVLA